MKPCSAHSGVRQLQRLALVLFMGVAILTGCTTAPHEIDTSRIAEIDRLHKMRDHAEGEGLQPSPPQSSVASESDPDQPAPLWVIRGQSDRYPIKHFIVGVGSCSATGEDSHTAMRVAQDRARNAIAKQIKVRIRSEFESEAEIITKTQEGKTLVEKNRSSVADRINSQADLQLEGAEIVGQWYDKANQTYWSFAALDRSITATGILDRMTILRERMTEHHQLATTLRNDAQIYQALRLYRQALDEALGLMNYRAQLRVIAPETAEAQADTSARSADFATLWKDIAETAQALRVVTMLSTDVDGRTIRSTNIETHLTAALQSLGLTLSKQPAALAEVPYATLKEMPPTDIRNLAGEDLNCLLLAKFSARHMSSEPMGSLTMHFYHAQAEALLIDLDAKVIAASVGFDYAPKTYTGNKNRDRAAEEALSKAAKELSARLKLTLEN